ncbi:MAG: PDZ domain-containing protein, partial [Firmicutes bacterium]|nr:PDZ domain-containing protein [Bacillota bacterium]
MTLCRGARSLRLRRLLLPAAAAVVLLCLAGAVLVAANYKHVGNLVRVLLLIRSQYLYGVDTATLVDGAIKGMVEALGDPYSLYLDPRTFGHLREQIEGSFGGLGILVGLRDHRLTVVRSYENMPAQRAGVRAGDVILKIGERSTEDMDLETAIDLMRGPVGTEVTLTVLREGVGEPLRFTIVRERIQVPTVESRPVDQNGVVHLAISQFTSQTGDEFRRVVQEISARRPKGIILDLRDNPGGELYAAVEVAGYFVPPGPVVHVEYRTGRNETLRASGRYLRLPLVVLVNQGTASAAEILAAAIKDRGTGVLVGTRTYGKGVVQSVFELENGAGLKLTTARYLTPSRQDIDRKGVEPDVTVV